MLSCPEVVGAGLSSFCRSEEVVAGLCVVTSPDGVAWSSFIGNCSRRADTRRISRASEAVIAPSAFTSARTEELSSMVSRCAATRSTILASAAVTVPLPSKSPIWYEREIAVVSALSVVGSAVGSGSYRVLSVGAVPAVVAGVLVTTGVAVVASDGAAVVG